GRCSWSCRASVRETSMRGRHPRGPRGKLAGDGWCATHLRGRSQVPCAFRVAARARMVGAVRVRRWLPLLVLGLPGLALAAPPCPGPATVAIQAENLARDGTVSLRIRGELLDGDTTCTGAGETSYDTTVTCTGQGTLRCGEVPGLRPGAWVHHVEVQVTGSDPQRENQRSVVVAGGPGVSN